MTLAIGLKRDLCIDDFEKIIFFARGEHIELSLPGRLPVQMSPSGIRPASELQAILVYLLFFSKSFTSIRDGTYSTKSLGHASLALRKRARASGRSPRRARYSPT